MIGIERFPLIGQGVEFFQLRNLPFQAFTLLDQVGLGQFGLLQGQLAGAPFLPQDCQGFGVNATVGVEQAAHRIGSGEALPGMLAMDVDQAIADFAQLGGGGGAAIDPGPAFALRVNGSFEQQAVTGIEARFTQPLLHWC